MNLIFFTTIIRSARYGQKFNQCIDNIKYQNYCVEISYNVNKDHLGDYTRFNLTYPVQSDYNFGIRHVTYNGSLFNITSYNSYLDRDVEFYSRMQNETDILVRELVLKPKVYKDNDFIELVFKSNYSLSFMTGPLFLDLLPANSTDSLPMQPMFSYPFVPDSQFTFELD